MGSLPDVSVFRPAVLVGEAIPRCEASLLSAQKRDELRQLHERKEQIRRHAIVLKFGDLNVSIYFEVFLDDNVYILYVFILKYF